MHQTNRMRRGATLVWSVVMLLGLVAIASLSLEWARVVMVRTQMRQAADSIAIAAASQLKQGTTRAREFAEKARLANTIGGQPAQIKKIEWLDWDSTHGQYTRVAVELEAMQVPLTLGQLVRMPTKTVSSRAVARVVPAVEVEQEVWGTANPFLSGMPKGTVASLYNPHNSPDYAGDWWSNDPRIRKQSPQPVQGLPIVPGQVLTFDNIAGTTRHDPNLPFYEPDGQTGENGTKKDIGRNTRGSEHGIADINCPINALVGVFLGPDRPDNTPSPETRDASTPESRNQLRYEPKLKQIFFIGDGTAWVDGPDGNKVPVKQEFVVPEGATRLYLATWDFYEWNNNAGERVIEIKRPQKVVLVE